MRGGFLEGSVSGDVPVYLKHVFHACDTKGRRCRFADGSTQMHLKRALETGVPPHTGAPH